VHKNKATFADALTQSVQEAWADLPSQTIVNVFEWVPIVHDIILADNVGNDHIEERRCHHYHHQEAAAAREQN
jgi:hypothetical protein